MMPETAQAPDLKLAYLASNQVVGSSNLSGRAIKSKACEIAGLFYGLHRS